jgi:hypothetical protein
MGTLIFHGLVHQICLTVNMIVERFEIDLCVTIIITLLEQSNTFESGIVYIIR